MIYPVQEVSKDFIKKVKLATKRKLIEKAIKDHHGTKPTDWVCRELVIGDSNVTDFYDLEYKNSVALGMPMYAIDAASLTADDLSSILADGETLDDGAYIGFYGIFDISQEPGELTGGADTPPNVGSLVSVEFLRGGSVLDFWE